MQGEKEDGGEAVGDNTGVNDDDESKDGNVCAVGVLVTAQVEDAQGEYADEGEGEVGNVRVVAVPAQGDSADDGEDDGEAKGDNTCVNDEDEDEDEDESGNVFVVVIPPLRYRGRCRNTTSPLNSIN